MINVVYLVIFLVGGHANGGGATSISIPQASMAQCQTNAKQFQGRKLVQGYDNGQALTAARCISGVK